MFFIDIRNATHYVAHAPADKDLPGFRLHPLRGERKGFWSVMVRSNWRVTFRFADRDTFEVDYLDYH